MVAHRLAKVFRIFFSVILLCPGWHAPAGAATDSGSSAKAILPAPVQISPHVYAWIGPYGGANRDNRGFRMNMAFVVGETSVAVLDTGYTEPMAREMLKYISAITPLPVKYAINTNSQPHRHFGNEVFRRRGASIIAQEKEARRMAAQGENFAMGIAGSQQLDPGSIPIPSRPDILIAGDASYDLGGLKIHVKSAGASHTPASLVVHIPADNVVYAGDILFSGRLLAILPDGDIRSWIAAFDDLKSFGDVLFVPGHGKPGKLKDFEFPTREYLVLLHTHMEKMVKEGVDLQTAIKRLDQARFSTLENYPELSGRNASQAYLESEKNSF
jgi:glyoxylase-like metal-dependent hydrolase (beta-lactamase superfamily II)